MRTVIIGSAREELNHVIIISIGVTAILKSYDVTLFRNTLGRREAVVPKDKGLPGGCAGHPHLIRLLPDLRSSGDNFTI